MKPSKWPTIGKENIEKSMRRGRQESRGGVKVKIVVSSVNKRTDTQRTGGKLFFKHSYVYSHMVAMSSDGFFGVAKCNCCGLFLS